MGEDPARRAVCRAQLHRVIEKPENREGQWHLPLAFAVSHLLRYGLDDVCGVPADFALPTPSSSFTIGVPMPVDAL